MTKSKSINYIDVLTDGQSGAGGFFLVIKNNVIVDTVNCEVEEEIWCEQENIEPFMELFMTQVKLHNITHVKDGNTSQKPMLLKKYIDMITS